MDVGTKIESSFLTRHAAILGMTGSGKTGLGIVLLEEARRQGIPMIVLDPKGDLGNLLLHDSSQFDSWATPDQITAWRQGITNAGLSEEDLQDLGRVPARIFTPGATYGTPLAVLDSMEPPERDDQIEEASTMASALLAMAGMDSDPMTPEHAVLSNLILHHWAKGESPGLAHLIGSVMRPPLQFIGALPMDSFLVPRKREALGRKLNTLLAAPGFKAWLSGHPMNPEELLYKDGMPMCSVLALAHLSEDERMFFTALLMSKLVSWMRRQPGTDSLRAIIYLDEAYGFCPPTKNPPSKQPIMTLLKQARAHGLGLAIATQNPVDLDYKAMSNCGTWLVGTLRTKQDRSRILDAVGESVGLNKGEADAELASLEKREFMLLDAKGQAERFRSRFALCLLRGPLTRDEVASLSTVQAIGTAEGHVVAYHNVALKLYSMPGESCREFIARCEMVVVEEVQAKSQAIFKKHTPILKKLTERCEDAKSAARLNANVLAAYEEEESGKTGRSVLEALMGGHSKRFIRQQVKVRKMDKGTFERRYSAAHQCFIMAMRREEELDEANQALQDEISAMEKEAYDRALDIVEVSS